MISKFEIVSIVLPDFETTIKQELLKFLSFLKFKYKFSSKLSKKNIFFFIFFLKYEYIIFAPRIEPPLPLFTIF